MRFAGSFLQTSCFPKYILEFGELDPQFNCHLPHPHLNLRAIYMPLRLDVLMPKRTAVVIQNDTYARLVEESIRKFGSARAISRVIDDMVKENSNTKKEAKKDILRLLHSKKAAKIT